MKFVDHLIRQGTLTIDDWRIHRFAYVTVRHSPRDCQRQLQQDMGRLMGRPSQALRCLNVVDREIVRHAILSPRAITPSQVASLLQVSRDTAQRYLAKLVKQGWLQPAGGSVRIRSYRVHPSRRNVQW